MTNIGRLSKIATSFQLMTEGQQHQKVDQLFTTISSHIAGLATGCITSVNHLLYYPKHQSSKILRNVLEQVSELATITKGADPAEAARLIPKYDELIGRLSFYGSSGNAGTGHDPILSLREGGYTDPAYYITSIDQLFRQIKGRFQQHVDPIPDNFVA